MKFYGLQCFSGKQAGKLNSIQKILKNIKNKKHLLWNYFRNMRWSYIVYFGRKLNKDEFGGWIVSEIARKRIKTIESTLNVCFQHKWINRKWFHETLCLPKEHINIFNWFHETLCLPKEHINIFNFTEKISEILYMSEKGFQVLRSLNYRQCYEELLKQKMTKWFYNS